MGHVRSLGAAVVLLVCCEGGAEGKESKAVNQISTATANLSAKAYLEPDAIQQLVGSDLGGHYIVIEMTVTPKGDKPVNVQLDQFTLFCEGDGDRTKPQTGAEVAATDSMVLKRGDSIVGSLGQETGAIWSGVGFGGRKAKEKADAPAAPAKVEAGKRDEGLKGRLTEKMLREGETSQPVAGLLYFPMEKKKLKNLVLFYDVPGGKVRLYFK